MKFCQKCWSDKLVHAPGLIICKGCGHSKKELNVVVNSQVDSGLYGKRMQSFITQKAASKNRMIEDNTSKEEQWKQHLLTFQKTLKSACESFISNCIIRSDISNLILGNLKLIWLKYLNTWKEINVPINSIFTGGREQEVTQTDSNFQMLQKIEEEDEEQPENSTKRRRRSTFVCVDFQGEDVQSIIIKEQTGTQNMTKQQLMNFVRQLTQNMTFNTHPYFKKLFKLNNLQEQMTPLIAKLYVLRLYYLHERRFHQSKQKLSYLKHKKLYLKRSWLLEMVKARNQPNYQKMLDKNLMIHIYMFDMLQFKLSIKSTQNNRTLKDMISRYTTYKKYNSEVINLFLNKFKLLTQFDNMYISLITPSTGVPPTLNFHLIFSFIHLALLKSQQVFYLAEIIEQTVIDIEPWVKTQYLKVNSTPSLESLRRSSIQLIKTLKLEFKQSNRGKWINRMSAEIGLPQCEQPMKVLVKTLNISPDWIVNEEIECLAATVIFIKLHSNLDQQANISMFPYERLISASFPILQNQNYKQIIEYYKTVSEIPQMQQQINRNFLFILQNIITNNQKIGTKRKYQQLSDLKYLNIKAMKQIKMIDGLLLQQSSSSYNKYKQIFYNISPSFKLSQQQYNIVSKTDQPVITMQFKSFLGNQIPNISLMSIQKQDVVLPSNNYQVINDYRSNYYSLEKFQFIELLGRLSENKCSIDDLYRKVEEFQKNLLMFEAN